MPEAERVPRFVARDAREGLGRDRIAGAVVDRDDDSRRGEPAIPVDGPARHAHAAPLIRRELLGPYDADVGARRIEDEIEARGKTVAPVVERVARHLRVGVAEVVDVRARLYPDPKSVGAAIGPPHEKPARVAEHRAHVAVGDVRDAAADVGGVAHRRGVR